MDTKMKLLSKLEDAWDEGRRLRELHRMEQRLKAREIEAVLEELERQGLVTSEHEIPVNCPRRYWITEKGAAKMAEGGDT